MGGGAAHQRRATRGTVRGGAAEEARCSRLSSLTRCCHASAATSSCRGGGGGNGSTGGRSKSNKYQRQHLGPFVRISPRDTADVGRVKFEFEFVKINRWLKRVQLLVKLESRRWTTHEGTKIGEAENLRNGRRWYLKMVFVYRPPKHTLNIGIACDPVALKETWLALSSLSSVCAKTSVWRMPHTTTLYRFAASHA